MKVTVTEDVTVVNVNSEEVYFRVLVKEGEDVMAEKFALQAKASAEAAKLDAQATAADRVQTGLDVIATAADRVKTGLDVIATAADRVQTGLDVIATAADRVQTGLDVIATGADRVQTGLDVIATAADRVQTGLDAQATAANRVQTGLDAQATAADRIQTGLDASTATAQAGIATTAAQSIESSILALGSISGTVDINLALGTLITATLTGATTLTFSGLPPSTRETAFTLRFAGIHAITLPAGTKYPAGEVPVPEGALYEIPCTINNAGNLIVYGVINDIKTP
jgi:uncharacterized phage infection (PIP) family protein YhgE